MRKMLIVAAAAAAALAALTAPPALAQATYPTPAGNVRVPGVVPLQCNASGAACVPVSGDGNGAVVQPALSTQFWAYAGAGGGIVNTTAAVTIKAAAGAGQRNYLCTLNVGHDALGAATELAVRDGAAGPVLFRMKLQTAALEGISEISFFPCLRGSANTLLEVVTLTATVTGGVYVNTSGYTGI